jgi:hypothetical protein
MSRITALKKSGMAKIIKNFEIYIVLEKETNVLLVTVVQIGN